MKINEIFILKEVVDDLNIFMTLKKREWVIIFGIAW